MNRLQVWRSDRGDAPDRRMFQNAAILKTCDCIAAPPVIRGLLKQHGVGCAPLSSLSPTSNLRNLSNLRILTSASESSLSERGSTAGWSVLIFFAVLLLSMAAFTGLSFVTGFFRFYPAVALFVPMWIPGMAGILAARHSKVKLLGTRRPRIRFLALAVIAPVGVCGIIRGALWLSGLETLKTDLREIGVGSTSLLAFGFLVSVLGAFGEEIGWRGFLGSVLARRLGFTPLVWISWLPWFLFYLWLFLLAGAYSKPAFGLQLLTVGTLLFGLNVSLIWLRLRAESLWPPVLWHAVHNFLVFNPVALGQSHRPWLTGELGIGIACGYLAICIGSLWDGSRGRGRDW
jgi:membrane protease YdiL (CAAX protease family)